MATDTLERDPKDRRQGKTGRRSTTAWAQDIATNPQTHSEQLRPTTDEEFRREQYEHQYNNPLITNNTSDSSRKIMNVQVDRRPPKQSRSDSSTPRLRSKGNVQPKRPSKKVDKKTKQKKSVVDGETKQASAIARGRATAVTFSIWGWGTSLWLLQFVCAVVMLVTIGVEESVSGSFWLRAADTLSFGIISSANLSIFALCWFIVFVIGWFTIASAILQYSIAFLHPLSGKAAVTKYITCIVAMALYIIPIANLFPWFFLYTSVVLRYPK